MKLTVTLFTILLFGLTFIEYSKGQTTNSPANQTVKNEPLKIKRKPQVSYTQGICEAEKGVVRLRVTFDKSKKVTNAEIVKSSGCERFDRNALAAAKKIKFNPAVENGEPVTVTRLVEYTFKIF